MSKTITVRLNQKEFDYISQKAKSFNLNRSELLRIAAQIITLDDVIKLKPLHTVES